MRKVSSNKMLVLLNVTMDVGTAQFEDDTIKCEKNIRESSNVTKVQSHVMLALPNVTIELSNVRKKIGYHQMCDKSTIRSDVGTIQCDDELSNVKKIIIMVPPNVKKVQS